MLYRKYRPKTFSEITGQQHVVKTLQGALLGGRVGHAYLFSGPRGTGKTTLARILAKSVNCEKYSIAGKSEKERVLGRIPCNVCASCSSMDKGTSLDLIEIDAASQTGVDDIRQLTDSVRTAAAGGRFMVFVIDEVHMLSKSAFNALLKTLEEPPSHAIFILATTEPNKILATVLSRVQRFDFKKLTENEILSKLKKIAETENIKIEDIGLRAIAKASDGALRDGEVLLSKLIAINGDENNISAQSVHDALGLIPYHYYPDFLSKLAASNGPEAISVLHTLNDSGFDLENFAKEFLEYARKVLITKVNPVLASAIHGNDDQIMAHSSNIDGQELINIINIFSHARAGMRHSPIPILPLELAVLDAVGK